MTIHIENVSANTNSAEFPWPPNGSRSGDVSRGIIQVGGTLGDGSVILYAKVDTDMPFTPMLTIVDGDELIQQFDISACEMYVALEGATTASGVYVAVRPQNPAV